MHFTNRSEECYRDSADPKSGTAGAPVCEIEVTEEMTDAGLMALQDHYLGDGSYDLTPPTLARVFLAMASAR